MDSERQMSHPLRRCGPWLVIGSYVGVSVIFLALHVLGDTRRYAVGYYFTWDMFPYFYCESTRTLAVGRTASGQFLELVPGPSERFRGGVQGDLNRADLDREGTFFRRLAERAARRVNERESFDPVVHVYLFENFWPAKFNLTDNLYQRWAAEEKPSVWQHWRLRGEFDVPAERPGKSHHSQTAKSSAHSKSAFDGSTGGRP